MERVIKIKLYQNLVNYRKEMSFGYLQTYPLPTPSMIKGMLHSILELHEYKSLKISIQGSYDSIVTNMQKIFKFDRKGRYPIPVMVKASEQSVNRGLMFVDSIVNCNLILHIKFDDDELNNRLFEEIQKKLIILGRNEDIARVDEVKFVNLEKEDDYILKNNMYLPLSLCKENQLTGTAYRLPFYYQDVKTFEDKRIFKFVDVMYITQDSLIESDVLVDKDNDIVSFLSVN